MANHQFVVRSLVRETPRALLLGLDAGGGRLSYAAGQAAMVGLADRPNRKPYSIASAPEEVGRSGLLEFLVEVGPDGEARPNLDGVAVGSAIVVEGPAGGFLLPPRLPPALLFVAGGTGIAPLRAMMHSALERRVPPSMTLVYSVRSPEELAFGCEFRRLSRQGRLRLCATVTREAGPTWKGRRGRIQQAWLARFVKDRAPLCFVCGPEAFVTHLMDMLREAGVPAGNILRDQH